MPVAPTISLALIGTITAALSAIGYLAGRALGHKIGPRLDVVGGLVLIAIALKMAIQQP